MVRMGVPDAASMVAKVWRRSWKRTGLTPASVQAALKRLVTFAPSSGVPLGEDEVVVVAVVGSS
jgi:hypothetical protein